MNLYEDFPDAWQFIGHYRHYWDDLDIDDEEEIVGRVYDAQGSADCLDYIRDARRLLNYDPFPWEEIVRWSNRVQPDEAAARAWLENYIALLERHVKAAGDRAPKPPRID